MNVEPFLIPETTTVLDAIAVIDQNRKGAAIVIDERRRLRGVITDGDVRRAILAGLDLRTAVSVLLARRADLYARPIEAPITLPAAERIALLRRYKIRHLPLVDDDGIVVDLAVLDDLVTEWPIPVAAVVMAGGFGTRLHPLTQVLPKAMLPVDGKPLLERLVGQLRDAGIQRVHIATHYKPESIIEHFGDGEAFGIHLDYLREEQPLGTAGALALLNVGDMPLLVVNGDILTKVDFAALFAFHAEHEAELTVGVRRYSLDVPYGVVRVDGVDVAGLEEKPRVSYFVNAGIYLIAPSGLTQVPRDGRRLDMTDLIQMLLERKRRVVSFPIREYWLDIGRVDDYERAQIDATSWSG